MMEDVRIYRPAKNAMQSGKAGRKWVMEFLPKDSRFVEPLMGWTGSSDTRQQLRLRFATEADAIAYAEKHSLRYRLILPKAAKKPLRSYAENFTKKPA